MATQIFMLTYWGNDQIQHLFSTMDKAINFAIKETAEFAGVGQDEVVLIVNPLDIQQYADPDVTVAVIIDPDNDDRMYTVTKMEMDPD